MIEQPPSERAVAAMLAALETQRQTLDSLREQLRRFTEVDREWARSHVAANDPIQVDLLHGPQRQWTFWSDLIAGGIPARPVAVFPDFSMLMSLVIDNLGLERSAALGDLGMRTRLVTSADQLVDETVRASVAAFAKTGIEVRTLPKAPGWFYVDESLAVLPLEWNDPVPSSLVITRDAAVVASLAAYFDDLWDRAQPPPGSSPDWEPVLILLAQGLSDGAIASTLELSVRTVRRRIAEAGAAFGVASRFALGVEWERSQIR